MREWLKLDIEKWTGREINREKERERERERATDRERERETDRQTDRQTDREEMIQKKKRNDVRYIVRGIDNILT